MRNFCKKSTARVFSFVLALIMITSLMPMSVFAYSSDKYTGNFRAHKPGGGDFVNYVGYSVPCGGNTISAEYRWNDSRNGWELVVTEGLKYAIYQNYEFIDNADMSGISWSYTSPSTGTGNRDTVNFNGGTAVSSSSKFRAEIQYKTEDGTVVDTGTYSPSAYGNDTVTASVPDGYKLVDGESDNQSVKTDKNGTTPNPIVFKVVSDALVVQDVTVTFDPNGGTVSPTTMTVKEGNALGTVPTPTRDDYEFECWISETGAPFTAETIVNSDMVVTAQWIEEAPAEKEYKLTYDGNGDSDVVTNVPAGETGMSSTGLCEFIVSSFEPEREGYKFLYWSPNPNDTDPRLFNPSAKITLAGNITLYAMWEQIATTQEYKIFYDGNAPGVTNLPETTKVTASKTFYRVPVSTQEPKRDGFKFLGWAKTKGATSYDYSSNSTIPMGEDDNEITLYALWKQVEDSSSSSSGSTTELFKIVYKDEFGSFPRLIFKDLELGTKTPIYDVDGDGEKDEPTRVGYTFEGWTPEVADTVTGNVTYNAIWEEIDYIIEYNLVGGTIPKKLANPTTYTIEDVFTLNNPTRAGYDFKGWKLELDGKKMEGKSKVVTIADMIGNRVYTATWEKQVYVPKEETVTVDTTATTYSYAGHVNPQTSVTVK